MILCFKTFYFMDQPENCYSTNIKNNRMFFNILCSSSGDCCPACCPSSCNNFTACSLCPPPSSCSQGFHINVEYFHLGQVDIPAQVTERYLTRTLLKVPASLNHCMRPSVIWGEGYWGWSWMGSFSL